MKILLVQESDWLKRNPHQQHHLMERLVLKGHEVRVIDHDIDWHKEHHRSLFRNTQFFDDVNKIYPEARVSVIRPSGLRLPLLEYPYLASSHRREIENQIRTFRPDLIIGLGILNTYLASNLAKKYGIPFIYYWIDVLHTLLPLKLMQPLAKCLEKATIRNASEIITINKSLGNYLIKMGVNDQKVRLVGAGIDFKRFDPAIDGSGIRKKYGVGENDLLMLYMGWLYHFSGLKELATALAKTIDSRPDIKLLIVGDGDAYNDLKDLIEKHRLDRNVIMAGKQPYSHIPRFIAASDVCLLTAYKNEKIMQDIVPIKMYEYMAMGKPVIATDLPGIKLEFGTGNGVIYVNDSEEALKKAIELKDSGALSDYGRSARVFAVKFDWEDITNYFENILNKHMPGGIS